LNEKGQPPSESRSDEDVVDSSATSSGEDVDKLAGDVEQKCRTEDTETAGGEDDKQEPSLTTQKNETSEITDKTAAGGTETLGASGNNDAAEDPEISFKKQAEIKTDQVNAADSKKARDSNQNLEDIPSNSKTTCCSA